MENSAYFILKFETELWIELFDFVREVAIEDSAF